MGRLVAAALLSTHFAATAFIVPSTRTSAPAGVRARKEDLSSLAATELKGAEWENTKEGPSLDLSGLDGLDVQGTLRNALYKIDDMLQESFRSVPGPFGGTVFKSMVAAADDDVCGADAVTVDDENTPETTFAYRDDVEEPVVSASSDPLIRAEKQQPEEPEDEERGENVGVVELTRAVNDAAEGIAPVVAEVDVNIESVHDGVTPGEGLGAESYADLNIPANLDEAVAMLMKDDEADNPPAPVVNVLLDLEGPVSEVEPVSEQMDVKQVMAVVETSVEGQQDILPAYQLELVDRSDELGVEKLGSQSTERRVRKRDAILRLFKRVAGRGREADPAAESPKGKGYLGGMVSRVKQIGRKA